MPTQQVQSASAGLTRTNRIDACHSRALEQAAHAYASSIHLRFVQSQVSCDRGWAVFAGDLGEHNPPKDGPLGVGTTLIFHRESKQWKHKDASSVCGTLNPEKPEARPKDAKIPQRLYFLGCLVG
jgi:hypothetical protein